MEITKLAIEKIKEIADEEDVKDLSLRIKVMGGGCAGMTQDIFFENIITEFDEVIISDGVQFIIDPISYQYLQNSTLDYIDSNINAGFKFIMDELMMSCGCGKSFG